jgi:hypothetical protein
MYEDFNTRHRGDKPLSPEELIGSSSDIDFVVSHIGSQDTSVRSAVTMWFDRGEPWANDYSEFNRPYRRMPDDVAALLIRDVEPVVANFAIRATWSLPLLIDLVLDPTIERGVRGTAAHRILALNGVDDLFAMQTISRQIPADALNTIASVCTSPDVLESLIADPELRDALLKNSALSAEQVGRFIGVIPAGRPAGDRESWARVLRAASEAFTAAGSWGKAGSHEAAELRSVVHDAGQLLAAAAPLCTAAADALTYEAEAAKWASDAITWALEISRYNTDPASMYPRLGISPTGVSSNKAPGIPLSELKDAASGMRVIAKASHQFRALAEGAAVLFEALGRGDGCLYVLRYGDQGFGDLCMSEILMLTTSDELRHLASRL